MSDKMKVIIDMETNVGRGDEQETTRNRVTGDLLSKGETTYLKYEEQAEDEESVRNVVKLSGEEVTIIRNGPVSMHQHFREGVTTEGHYGTPFGTMQMETDTKKVDYEWHSDIGTGKILLSYLLKLQGNDLGKVTLTFSIKEVEGQ